jgi:GAF domain-containing protein
MQQADLFQEIVQSPAFMQVLKNTSSLLGDALWWVMDGEGNRQPLRQDVPWCPLARENDSLRQRCQSGSRQHLERVESTGNCQFQNCCQGYLRAMIPFYHQNRLIGCLGVCYIRQSDATRARSAVELLEQYVSLYSSFLSEYDDLEYIHGIWEQMVSTTSLEQLLPQILHETLHALGLNRGVLYLVDDDGRLEPRIGSPGKKDQADYPSLEVEAGPYQARFEEEQEEILELGAEDPLSFWTFQNLDISAEPRTLGDWNSYAIAIRKEERLLGMLVAQTKKGGRPLSGPERRMLGIITDGAAAVLENAMNLDRVQQRSLALSTIHTIHRLMGSVNSQSELLDRISRLTAQALRVRKCSIMMLLPDGSALSPVAKMGLEEGEIGTQNLSPGSGIPGWVWENYEPIIVQAPRLDPRFSDDPPAFYPEKSYLAVPMIEEDLMGVIMVSGRGHPFSPADREVLLTLTEQAVIALGNIRLIEQHQDLVVSSLRSIANVVEMRDPANQGHTERVEEVAVALGRKVSTDSRWLLNLRYATLLHDSGKIGLLQQSSVQSPSQRRSVADEHGSLEQIYREHP